MQIWNGLSADLFAEIATAARKSLFQRRGRAPDRPPAQWWFHAIGVTERLLKCECLATLWLIGGLRRCCGAVFVRSPLVSTVFALLETAGDFHATSSATLKTFTSRLSQLLQRGRSQSGPARHQNPQSQSGIGSSRHGSMASRPRSMIPAPATDAAHRHACAGRDEIARGEHLREHVL